MNFVKKNLLKQTDKEIEDLHAEMMADAEAEQEQMDAQQAEMEPENGEEPAPDGGQFPEAPPEQV